MVFRQSATNGEVYICGSNIGFHAVHLHYNQTAEDKTTYHIDDTRLPARDSCTNQHVVTLFDYSASSDDIIL